MALPVGATFVLGWQIDPDRVQGSLYLRTGDGIRYIGPRRDDNPSSELYQRTMGPDIGFEVQSLPVGTDGGAA